MRYSLPFGENYLIYRFQPTKPVPGIISTPQANLPFPPLRESSPFGAAVPSAMPQWVFRTASSSQKGWTQRPDGPDPSSIR